MVWSQLSIYRLVAKSRDELVSAIPCIDWVQQSRYKLGKVLSIVSYLHLLDLCGLVMK